MINVFKVMKYAVLTFIVATAVFGSATVWAGSNSSGACFPPRGDSWFSDQLKQGVTFSYDNSTCNPAYNCLAYVLGATTTWIWPWGSRDATLSEMTTVLTEFGYVTRNPGPDYYPPRAVVYGSSSEIGHIAKAGSYSSSVSKWGPYEVVSTGSTDPYRSRPNGYGPAVQYYW